MAELDLARRSARDMRWLAEVQDKQLMEEVESPTL